MENIIENVLLTDFDTEEFKGIKKLKQSVKRVKAQLEDLTFLMGEIGKPNIEYSTLHYASHQIKNIKKEIYYKV